MESILFKVTNDEFHVLDPYYGGIWNFDRKEIETYLTIIDLIQEKGKKLSEIREAINSVEMEDMIDFMLEERMPVDTTFYPQALINKLDTCDKGIIVPPEVILEVNRMCNYNCPWCYIPSMEYEQAALSHEQITENIIKPFVTDGAKSWTITGGESSLTIDRTLKIIEEIRDLSMLMWNREPQISLLTNGYNFEQVAEQYWNAGVRAVQIQLSSPYEEEELKLRRPNSNINSYNHAISGIKKAKELGFFTAINMVVEPSNNINSIDEMVRLGEELQVNLLRITPVVNAGKAKQNNILLNIENYKRILELTKKGKAGMKKESKMKVYLPDMDLEDNRPMRCGLGYVDFYIDYRGTVYPCNNLIEDKLICDPGSIQEFPGPMIWYKSKVLNSFRNYNDNNIGEECGTCKERGICVGNCIARCYQMYGKFNLLSKPNKCFNTF